MRRLDAFVLTLTVALLAFGGPVVPTASADALCKTAGSPCTGGIYGKGTAIEASLKSGAKSVLDVLGGGIECSEASIKGEVTNPGSEGISVSGSLSSLSFGSCSSPVSVLKAGSFSISSPSEGNGTLKLEGFETTVEFLGFHCIFSGSTTISLQGGEMASIGSTATLSRTGGRSGSFCGSSAPWTVEYTVTAPEPLYVVEVTSPVLCKTAGSPCIGGAYGKGTAIEASLKSGTKSVLHGPLNNLECSEASLKGEVTNAGGEGVPVSGPLSSLSFGSCSSPVSVLKAGSFSISSPSEGNGTLKLEGFEITTELAGFHCIFSGSTSIPLKGGEMAMIAGTATLSRTGGRSGSLCGSSAPLTIEYTVTAPEPLYVE